MRPYYEHAGITIYHGDCRDVLPSIAADALITDPPYGIGLAEGYNSGKPRSGYLHKGSYSVYDDTRENLRAIVVPVVTAALAIVKRGAVFCARNTIGDFPEPVTIGGIYVPNACGRTAWGFTNLHPVLLYGSSAANSSGGGCGATMIRSTESAESNGHPCPKPIGWMTWLVGIASLRGEVVLDPFMGSGTTLRAAKELGRRAIGIELEERYCEIAARSLAQEMLL